MKSFAKILIIALTLCSAVLLVSCQKSEKGNSVQTFQGYITSEDDFADGKGEDTADKGKGVSGFIHRKLPIS